MFCCNNIFVNFIFPVCPKEDLQCMRDRLGYEAIKQLHKQIDDDENGSLDRSESDGVSLRSLL